MNPYLFIVGCPRSGTTLLRRIVDAHPEIAITRETHWIPEFFKRRTGITSDGLVEPELLAALVEHPRFQTLGVEQRELQELLARKGPVSYAAFVSALFDLYGAKQGKRHVGDKTPGYSREIGILHELWPQARFVHLIRDGRDVCLSATSWKRKTEQLRRRFRTWGEDPVTTAALWWRWHVEPGREEGRELGSDRYYEMRYETLVEQPDLECRSFCEFLGLAFDEGMLRFHQGRVKSDSRLSAKHAWLPPTTGLRDWRTEMSSSDVEHFEAAAGDLLDELGYGRASGSPRASSVERASVIAARFDEDAPTLGLPLPEGW